MTEQTLTGAGLMLLALGTVVFIVLALLAPRPRPRPPKPLDVDAARRESHALGLPFPESDGTLSEPPPTPEQTHEQIHARRRHYCSTCLDKRLIKMVAVLADYDSGRPPKIIELPCHRCVAKH